MHLRKGGLLLLGLLLLIPSALLAHDTWLLPRAASVRPSEQITLDMTSGMRFPALESAPGPDRIAQASIRCGGKTASISGRKVAKKALTLAAAPPGSGIAAIWVDTKPKDIELKAEQVKEYLEEIGASDTVGRDWEKSGSTSWREVYTKHSKTFVLVGDPANDLSWGEPVGETLEIVPEKDPTALHAGEEFSVRVLLDGKPLPAFAVAFVAADSQAGTVHRTDSEGRASSRLDRAGWWLVKGTHIQRSAKPETDWESRFATLTVKARPSR